MITPTPYPTDGNPAVANSWDCQQDATDATLQHCAVTGWATTSTISPDPSFNSSDAAYGNWSSSWPTYLTGIILAAAFCIVLSGMIIGMARKAVRA